MTSPSSLPALCISAIVLAMGSYPQNIYVPPGTGTFGRVVLARDIPTRTFFALKIMTIAEVIRLKQVEHVNSEKNILASISHPFIVNM